MLARQAAGKLVEASHQALAKLETVLPKVAKEQVDELSETIRFLLPEHRFNLEDRRLATLREAIRDQRVVHITYHSYTRNEVTRREVEPHELLYGGDSWYMRGFCRLRQDIREFRLDRIDELRLLVETFVKQVLPEPNKDYEVVQLRIAAADRRWVDEYQHYAFQGEETLADGSIVMTYHPNHAIEMKPWILMWGAQVNVLSPLSLRTAIREEALRLAELLT
jgi:predicted DNA-binding transcriptional regulator YafY